MVLESKDSKGRIRESGNNITRYIKSLKHALEGVLYVIKNEHNIIIIITAIIFTTIMGFIFNISNYEWIAVVICFGCVLACEMINTAIEACIDLVTSDFKPLAKLSKDCASSATLIFSIMSFVVALIIFIPKII